MPSPATRLRLFIASDLPDAVKTVLGERAAALRRAVPAASWGRAETYHITYAFLGDQDERTVAPLADALETALGSSLAFDATVGSSGFFPDARRPRVAWVGLRPPEAFAALADAVRGAVRSAGVGMDEKPFAPHMTIARMKAPWRRGDTEAFGKAFGGIALAARVDVVSLYMSRLTTGGAQHTPLRVVRLAARDLSRSE